jgi:HEAT repeat protein
MLSSAGMEGPGGSASSASKRRRPARGRRVALSVSAAGLAVLAVTAVALFPFARESWQIRKLGSEDREERIEAARELAETGTVRALPALFEALGSEVLDDTPPNPFLGPFRRLAARCGRSAIPALERAAAGSTGHHSLEAVDVLLDLDPRNPAAIDALVRGMEDRVADLRAKDRLTKLGAPGYAAAIESGGRAVRRWVFEMIESEALDDLPESLRRILVKALESDDRLLRVRSAGILGMAGVAEEVFLPHLLDGLRAGDEETRAEAARYVGEIGPVCEAARSALLEMLKDSSVFRRVPAAVALDWLEHDRKVLLPFLIEGLDAPSPTFGEAYHALVRFRGDAVPAIEAMIRRNLTPGYIPMARRTEVIGRIAALMKDPDPKVRTTAERLIRILVPFENPRTFLDAIRDGDAEAVPRVFKDDWAVIVLGAMETIADSLRSPDRDLRRDAAVALARMGPVARSARPLLAEVLQDPDEEVRAAVTKALESMRDDGPAAGTRAAEMRPLIERTLARTDSEEDRRERAHAASALALLGIRDVSPFLEALKAGPAREPALEALEAIGPASRTEIPVLVDLLRDRNLRHRAAAARILEGFGPDAREALPALEAARRDRSSFVRDAVRNAIAAILGEEKD